MSLEQTIDALTRTMQQAQQQSNLAVQEIIRQRDAAMEDVARQKRFMVYAERDRDSYSERARKAERSNAALRGAIKRMKNKSAAGRV